MAISVQDLRSLLERALDDDSLDIDAQSFLDFADDLNQFAYNLLYRNDWEKHISETTLKLVSWTDNYATPANFLWIDLKWWWVYEYQTVDTNKLVISDKKLSPTSIWSSKEWFWFNSSDEIVFTPFPNSSWFHLAYDAQTWNFTTWLVVTWTTSWAYWTISAQKDSWTTWILLLSNITWVFQNNETITDTSTWSATSDWTLMTPYALRYLAWVSLFTEWNEATETLVIPERFRWVLRAWIKRLWREWNDSDSDWWNLESLEDSRFARYLSDMLRNSRRMWKVLSMKSNNAIY